MDLTITLCDSDVHTLPEEAGLYIVYVEIPAINNQPRIRRREYVGKALSGTTIRQAAEDDAERLTARLTDTREVLTYDYILRNGLTDEQLEIAWNGLAKHYNTVANGTEKAFFEHETTTFRIMLEDGSLYEEFTVDDTRVKTR